MVIRSSVRDRLSDSAVTSIRPPQLFIRGCRNRIAHTVHSGNKDWLIQISKLKQGRARCSYVTQLIYKIGKELILRIQIEVLHVRCSEVRICDEDKACTRRHADSATRWAV